jgi:fatty-acyl-CoA synthase
LRFGLSLGSAVPSISPAGAGSPAFVELKPGADEAELVAFCRDRLANFKAPRKVVFGPLPKTSTGKIRKFVLRSQAREL